MAVRCDSQEIRIVEDSGFAKLVIRKTEERLSSMFLTYDGERSEVGNPERCRDGYVGGIAAGCHEHVSEAKNHGFVGGQKIWRGLHNSRFQEHSRQTRKSPAFITVFEMAAG
jgi:hypothetical protein